LAAALANLAPAINFPRPAITDGSDHVRTATLRGLAPDQTLVLVNGTRGHIAALVAVNGSIGRGSTAFDLNTIPSVTLSTVEVLRDGASAQYGADAIAGVINLRLREEREGGSITANYGVYGTRFDTARGTRDADDGVTQSVAGWQGLPLGEEGFLTVSGEYVKRNPTNRSDFAAPSAVANGDSIVLGRFGDPELESLTGYVNAGLPLNETWELYGTAGYQDRTSEAAATNRPFNDARNVLAIYPGGFTPLIATDIVDYNLIGGIRGDFAGFGVDLNVSFGANELDYTVKNSLNTTFGAASPRTFNAGGLGYDQLVIGLDVTRPYEVGFAGPLNVAFGTEYRREPSRSAPARRSPTAAGPSRARRSARASPASARQRHRRRSRLDRPLRRRGDRGHGRPHRRRRRPLRGLLRLRRHPDRQAVARYDFTTTSRSAGTASKGFKRRRFSSSSSPTPRPTCRRCW
jgi:iron complex outermembrane receptor protein